MKSLFEQLGGTYREENGYLIPSIEVPNDTVEIGKYGRLHRDYLKKNHRSIYGIMLCNGSLLKRIESVDIQANELHNTLIPKYKKLYGVTEQLKEENPIRWAQEMNTISHQIDEFILSEVVYRIV